MIYAPDTNIVSYYLKGDRNIIRKIDNEALKGNVVIPPMVYYEIKKWLLKNNSTQKIKSFENLVSKYGIEVIGKEAFDLSASIYVMLKTKGITVDDADLFIASYCLQNDCVLITNNARHFENIENLRFENWLEL